VARDEAGRYRTLDESARSPLTRRSGEAIIEIAATANRTHPPRCTPSTGRSARQELPLLFTLGPELPVDASESLPLSRHSQPAVSLGPCFALHHDASVAQLLVRPQ
jgi:hypothetical protein